jgi:hypothetical protein
MTHRVLLDTAYRQNTALISLCIHPSLRMHALNNTADAHLLATSACTDRQADTSHNCNTLPQNK